MADPGTALAIASISLSGAQMYEAREQGERQKESAKRALQAQKATQAVARSSAASERLAQSAEARRRRQRKPNTAAIMARAKQRRMSGETFLSNQQGMGMLDRSRYLG